jgi:hypothetical protein
MYVDTPTKSKRVVRRNLPINDKYTLIDSFYSSMENGNCCDNCNKIIANIAVIKNADNKIFNVGLDCAETLTRLDGLFSAQMQFNEAKGIRAKVNKGKKDGMQITFENNCLSDILVKFNDNTRLWLKKEFVKKYLPDYFANIVNPDKNDFKAIETTDFCPYTSKETDTARAIYKDGKTYQYNQFTINVYLKQGLKMDGTPNGSWLFVTDILSSNTVLSTDSTYMVKDVNRNINWQLNTILFNEFNNPF